MEVYRLYLFGWQLCVVEETRWLSWCGVAAFHCFDYWRWLSWFGDGDRLKKNMQHSALMHVLCLNMSYMWCMHGCVCVMCACVFVCMCARDLNAVQMRSELCVWPLVCVWLCLCVSVCVLLCVRAQMCVCVCVRVRANACVCECVHVLGLMSCLVSCAFMCLLMCAQALAVTLAVWLCKYRLGREVWRCGCGCQLPTSCRIVSQPTEVSLCLMSYVWCLLTTLSRQKWVFDDGS